MGSQDGKKRAQVRLRQLRQRIERWRWRRAKRSPMPQDLWSAATDLGRELGAYRVAHDLGIGYQSLKDRRGDDIVAEPRQAQSFVEIDTAPLFAPSRAAHAAVELSDTSGTKMVIRLGASETVDVGALVAAFRAAK